ncbi:MAG: sulfurtransferase TusA family protein [Acidobacteriota bacterium]
MADVELDCKGLNCPMPIVKISRSMRQMTVGQVLAVEADDPSFTADVEAWARKMGHTLVELKVNGPVQRALLEKRK